MSGRSADRPVDRPEGAPADGGVPAVEPSTDSPEASAALRRRRGAASDDSDLQRPRGSRRAAAARAMLSPRRISAIYLWIGFTILFGILQPRAYLSVLNYRLVFSEGAVTCMLALAFLVPLAAGAYDLSVGGLLALSVGVSIWIQIHTHLAPGLGAVLAVLATTAAGFGSGFIVIKLRVNSFIATLAMSQILLAIVTLISGNRQLIATFSTTWTNLGNDNRLGIPIVDYYLVGVAIVLWFVLEHTAVGRFLFAVGGNPEAARLSGVPTDKLIWGSLTVSGTISGLAGVIYCMRVGTFDPTVGPGYLFPAVTAVFLGASQLRGRPNVWGTLIAYFALAFGIQGLAISSDTVSIWSEPLFQGVALVLAVSLAVLPTFRRKRLKARGDALIAADVAGERGA